MDSNLLQKSVSIVPWTLRRYIKHIPLIAPLQRWIVNYLLRNNQFVYTINAGPARGLHYPVHLPEDKQIWTGTYEVEFSILLANAVKPGDVCYDIGGFRGFFSGVLALAGAKQVCIFEPFPENCQQIQAVIDANPGLSALKLHEMALGEQSGNVEFLVMPESSMGKLASSSFQLEVQEQKKISVPIESIDELIKVGSLKIPNLIKIDVEGAELSVLKGAFHTLKKAKPILFIEIHSRELSRDCYEFLKTFDYSSIIVLETNKKPDFITEPEVCHFIVE
ncbi:MAG: FkbM family methyltransferase [Moorea sp. SIO3C2]|nr:FkbM family methyltransferase [Moorena sp. SIO3C2]